MANLKKSFEKSVRLKSGKVQHQLLVVEFTGDNQGDSSYEDFEANLFINGEFVADLSTVLGKAGVLEKLVDDIDWRELQLEARENNREAA